MTESKRGSALLVQALEEERNAALVRAEKAEACEKTLLRQWNDVSRERDRLTNLWHEWHDRAARAEAALAASEAARVAAEADRDRAVKEAERLHILLDNERTSHAREEAALKASAPTCAMCSKPMPVACDDCTTYALDTAGVPRKDPSPSARAEETERADKNETQRDASRARWRKHALKWQDWARLMLDATGLQFEHGFRGDDSARTVLGERLTDLTAEIAKLKAEIERVTLELNDTGEYMSDQYEALLQKHKALRAQLAGTKRETSGWLVKLKTSEPEWFETRGEALHWRKGRGPAKLVRLTRKVKP